MVWKVTESEAELAAPITLTERCKKRLLGMKSEMHRRAFLSIRHLLALEGYEDENLIYSEIGKPFLTDGKYISISHSHNYTGIIVSATDEVGIDIEKQRDKILRIAHKFTPLEEYRTIANTDAVIQKLTQVWCAKEALYKIYATPGISFRNHIDVFNFSLTDAQTVAQISYAGKLTQFQVYFDTFDDFSMAYALKTS